MRTTKRFTPRVLARFYRQLRGTGTYCSYIPWHRVTRGDPASSGRSHLLEWRNRLRELLSDQEFREQLFVLMLPHLDDCNEQFRLTPEPSRHPLTAYGDYVDDREYPGTLALASELGIRHPIVRDKGEVADWSMTTDLFVVTKRPSFRRAAIAVAVKAVEIEALTKRDRELLALERQYWIARNVTWLLITPTQYDPRVARTIVRTAPWTIAMEVSPEALERAVSIVVQLGCVSLTQIIDELADQLSSRELAPRALWQAVWRGLLPIDLRRGWRPREPLNLISLDQFQSQNPILARRSAWI